MHKSQNHIVIKGIYTVQYTHIMKPKESCLKMQAKISINNTVWHGVMANGQLPRYFTFALLASLVYCCHSQVTTSQMACSRKNCAIYKTQRGCLIGCFEQHFSVFKQYYIYFHTFFYLHVFSKNTNNVSRTTLPNGPKIAYLLSPLTIRACLDTTYLLKVENLLLKIL